MMRYKFAIVVLSEETNTFTKKDHEDPEHPINLAIKCEELITAALKKKCIQPPPLLSDNIQELLENSYDSYAKRGLVKGQSLEIELIVKETHTGITIQIKDNGSGFANQEKGIFFSGATVSPEKKDRDNFFGGEGIGLKMLQKTFEAKGINLFFKNRKKIGATAQIEFYGNKDSFEL